MNLNKLPAAPMNVVFDLGGVMVEISHTWEDAAASAGVFCKYLSNQRTRLGDLPAFSSYQTGHMSLESYLGELAKFVGCEPEDALALHNGILGAEYPDIAGLVQELQYRKLNTGCLSNTNEPHWEKLTQTGQYPSIHSLDMKMASHLVGLSKPSPAIYAAYCETFGIEPESIAFFDDYPENVEVALLCGWNARWIDSTLDTPAQIRAYLLELGVL